MAKSYKYSRSRKALDLETVQLRLVDAIKAMEKIILTEESDPQAKIQAVNALSGLANRYAKFAEAVDLEKRIAELEKELEPEKSEE